MSWGSGKGGFNFNPARQRPATPPCRAAPAQPGSGHAFPSSSSARVFALSARLGGLVRRDLLALGTLELLKVPRACTEAAFASLSLVGLVGLCYKVVRSSVAQM